MSTIAASPASRPVAAGHGAHQRDGGEAPCAARKARSSVRLALGEIEGEVAAKDRAPLPREAVFQRQRDRAYACDRGDADGDAGEENAEAAEAAAQIAQRQTQDKWQAQDRVFAVAGAAITLRPVTREPVTIRPCSNRFFPN